MGTEVATSLPRLSFCTEMFGLVISAEALRAVQSGKKEEGNSCVIVGFWVCFFFLAAVKQQWGGNNWDVVAALL